MKRAPDAKDEPLDRLFKLLPAESTAAFLLLRGVFPIELGGDNFEDEAKIFYGLVLIVVILTPVLLIRVWDIKDRWIVTFMTGSFVVWALNIDIERVTVASEILIRDVWSGFEVLLNPLLIKGLLIVWAIVLVPLIIPKKSTLIERDGDENNQTS